MSGLYAPGQIVQLTRTVRAYGDHIPKGTECVVVRLQKDSSVDLRVVEDDNCIWAWPEEIEPADRRD